MNQRHVKSPAKNVVITGVTRGLGRAMAEEFIRRGYKVFGCARTTTQINDLKAEHPEHDFQVVDVSSDAAVRDWARRLIRKCDCIDVLLNNAAVFNAKGPLWRVPHSNFSDEIDINIKGVVNVARHFCPSMIRQRRGIIINFVSRWGTKFEPNMAPYCATKWAVVAISRVLAQELKAANVAVVALNPGIVKTSMLKKYLSDCSKRMVPTAVRPAEWASQAVPFILGLSMRDSGKVRRVPLLRKPLSVKTTTTN
jgi:NAD(P)-dependent dehydrogenase (short-subunit alcohol dehydrogenase family)